MLKEQKLIKLGRRIETVSDFENAEVVYAGKNVNDVDVILNRLTQEAFPFNFDSIREFYAQRGQMLFEARYEYLPVSVFGSDVDDIICDCLSIVDGEGFGFSDSTMIEFLTALKKRLEISMKQEGGNTSEK